MARSLFLPVAALLLLALAVSAYPDTTDGEDNGVSPTLTQVVDEEPPTDGEPKPEYPEEKPVYKTKSYGKGWDMESYNSYKSSPKSYKNGPYGGYGYTSVFDVCELPEGATSLEDAVQLNGPDENPCTVVLSCECKCTTDNAIVDKKTGAQVGQVDGYGGETGPCMCPRALSLCNCPDFFDVVLGRRNTLQCVEGDMFENPCFTDEQPCVKPRIKPMKRPGVIKFKTPKTWDKSSPDYFPSYPEGKAADYYIYGKDQYGKDYRYINPKYDGGKDYTKYTGEKYVAPKYTGEPKYTAPKGYKAPKGGKGYKAPKGGKGYKAPKYSSKYKKNGGDDIPARRG